MDEKTSESSGSGRPKENLLTSAELRVLAAIEDLIHERGYAPSEREIAARVGWRSSGSTHQYLGRLRDLGVIEGSGRALRIVDPIDQSVRSDPIANQSVRSDSGLPPETSET